MPLEGIRQKQKLTVRKETGMNANSNFCEFRKDIRYVKSLKTYLWKHSLLKISRVTVIMPDIVTFLLLNDLAQHLLKKNL